MIFGIGIDLIETERIADRIGDAAFLNRLFTKGEQEYCGQFPDPAPYYAARFAAKEAFTKALGIGWEGILSFQDVEVVHASNGRPEISLSEQAKTLIGTMGIKNIHLSLSHIKAIAEAIVILEK